MKITLISDTHSKHGQITNDLPGGDLIIHAGDLSSMGYQEELKWFFEWYKQLPYDHKVLLQETTIGAFKPMHLKQLCS